VPVAEVAVLTAVSQQLTTDSLLAGSLATTTFTAQLRHVQQQLLLLIVYY